MCLPQHSIACYRNLISRWKWQVRFSTVEKQHIHGMMTAKAGERSNLWTGLESTNKTGTVLFLKSKDKQKHRNCQTRRKEKGESKKKYIHLSPWPVTSMGTQRKKKKRERERKEKKHNMSPSTVYITYLHSKRPFPQIKCLWDCPWLISNVVVILTLPV